MAGGLVTIVSVSPSPPNLLLWYLNLMNGSTIYLVTQGRHVGLHHLIIKPSPGPPSPSLTPSPVPVLYTLL